MIKSVFLSFIPSCVLQCLATTLQMFVGSVTKRLHPTTTTTPTTNPALPPVPSTADVLKQHMLTTAYGLKRYMTTPPTSSLPQKVLVLDLDETLLHTTPIPPQCTQQYTTVYVGTDNIFFVVPRPHLYFFLYTTTKQLGYNVYVFTAGVRPYAHAVMHALSIDTFIPKRNVLCREDCSLTTSTTSSSPSSAVYKDLLKIKAPLSSIIHIDNEAACFRTNPFNGIHVPSFHHTMTESDECLLNLLPTLAALRDVADVRTILRHTILPT
eukprot:PhF_6_TR4990/c0_g1_i1/m.7060/K17617/CTDNEP1, DULLARD, NEM1; CTD nuclear envelope phosphatase 1